MKTLLVPVDFSAVTSRVIAEAVALSRTLGARVVVLNVTEPTVSVVDYAIVAFSVAQVNEAVVKNAVARLDRMKEELERDGVTVETLQVVGSPVPEILDQARKLSADYILIGSHGHTAFYDLLVGGTTSGVLKRAPCPVVIIPAAARSEDEAEAGA